VKHYQCTGGKTVTCLRDVTNKPAERGLACQKMTALLR
jgi:hypothetical protein